MMDYRHTAKDKAASAKLQLDTRQKSQNQIKKYDLKFEMRTYHVYDVLHSKETLAHVFRGKLYINEM
jgi:hypothetical protein